MSAPEDGTRKRALSEEKDQQTPSDETAKSASPSTAKKARPDADSATTTQDGQSNREVGKDAPAGAAPHSHPQQQQQQQPQQQQQRQHQRPPSQPHPAGSSSAPPPRRDHSFFGMDVMDDVVRTIGEFLQRHCHHANVEIEAKLGVLIDKNTGRRIELPVQNEVIVDSRMLNCRFSSDMTADQHRFFNHTLNNRLGQTQVKDYPGYKIQYNHTKEIDQFFTGGQFGKTRVTLDQTTRKVIENGIVKKDRIADLDVYSPRNRFDFRVSVNVEVPVPPPTGSPQFERHKDRISYRHHNFKIDLTQVKTNNATHQPPPRQHNYSQMRPTGPAATNNSQPDTTHELEIEFVHPEELMRELSIREKSQGTQPDRFMDIVGWFVNNVRGLVAHGNRAPIPGAAPQNMPPGSGGSMQRRH